MKTLKVNGNIVGKFNGSNLKSINNTDLMSGIKREPVLSSGKKSSSKSK